MVAHIRLRHIINTGNKLKLNTAKSFLFLILLFGCLWYIHMLDLMANVQTPKITNPSNPLYNSIWLTFKYYFTTFSAPILLTLTYILDRRNFHFLEKKDGFLKYTTLEILVLALFGVTTYALIRPITFLSFVGAISSVPMLSCLPILLFAQVIWIVLLIGTVYFFGKHYTWIQTIYLSSLTLLTAQLIWELPIEIHHWAATTFTLLDLTLYIARYVSVYYLLSYLPNMRFNYWLLLSTWTAIVSGIMLYFFTPFQQQDYFRVFWVVPLIILAYLMKREAKVGG